MKEKRITNALYLTSETNAYAFEIKIITTGVDGALTLL